MKELAGSPDPKHISTSDRRAPEPHHADVHPRFTGLTNAFSKPANNHAAIIALDFMWYHFGRVHQTMRFTPAMEAGVTGDVWSVEEMVSRLE